MWRRGQTVDSGVEVCLLYSFGSVLLFSNKCAINCKHIRILFLTHTLEDRGLEALFLGGNVSSFVRFHS